MRHLIPPFLVSLVAASVWSLFFLTNPPVFSDSLVIRGSVQEGKCVGPWRELRKGLWQADCMGLVGGDCNLSWNVMDDAALQQWFAPCDAKVTYQLSQRSGLWTLEVLP